MGVVLRVDPIACKGRGLCIEMLPELVRADDWGYPIIAATPVPPWLDEHVRRTVAACPTLALRLEPVPTAPRPAAASPQATATRATAGTAQPAGANPALTRRR